MAKVKVQSKAVVPWDEEMAALAEKMGDARSTGAGGNFIGTRGAVFSVGGEEIGQEMDVVILDCVNENQYYDPEIPFDPSNPQPPICYAFGRNVGDMAPFGAAPEQQNEDCTRCPKNAFGSAGKGRKGKACKNVLMLYLITEGDLEDTEKAEVYKLKVSATNVRYYNDFYGKVKNPNMGLGKRPLPCAVVCRMTIKPDKDTQIKLGFEIKEKIETPAAQQGLLKKVKEQLDKEFVAYPLPGENEKEEEKPAKSSKFTRRKVG